MHTSKNYKRVFVARNCARTSGLTSANLVNKLAYGEVAVVSAKGALINTVAAAQAANAIRVVVGTKDGSPIFSDLIYKKELLGIFSSKFDQKQERKVIIGYDGSANDIDVIAGSVYAIEVDHIFRGAYSNEALTKRVSYEAALTGETQHNIAIKLAGLLALDYSLFTEKPRVNVIGSEAGLAAMTGGTVVHGSATVTYTGGAAPALGSLVVVPGLTGGIHRDEDNTVYKVIYVDAGSKVIELDRPYQNRDQAGLAINEIAAPAGDYGITIEGMHMNVKFGEAYSVMDFDVRAFEFGDTPLQYKGATLAIDHGFGRHEEVRNLEKAYGDGEGRNIYQEREFQNFNINTDENTGYSLLNIKFDHQSNPSMMEDHLNPKELDIFLQRGTYVDIKADAAGTAFGTNIQTGTGLVAAGDSDSLINVLNAFAVGAGVLLATANSTANGGKEMTAGTTFSTGIDV